MDVEAEMMRRRRRRPQQQSVHLAARNGKTRKFSHSESPPNIFIIIFIIIKRLHGETQEEEGEKKVYLIKYLRTDVSLNHPPPFPASSLFCHELNDAGNHLLRIRIVSQIGIPLGAFLIFRKGT